MRARAFAAACALMLPLPALSAERLADFAWSVPIELDAREGLHQLELDARVHQGIMRRDLGDIRVFNAAGESVPYAFAPAPHFPAASQGAIALPFFPVHAERGVPMEGVELKIRTRPDGTLLGLSAEPPRPGSAKGVIGYLIDASGTQQPLAALRLQWAAIPGGTHSRVRLEASDDLLQWRIVADAVPLIDLEFGGHRLQRDAIAFAPRKLKYLRLSWLDGQEPARLSGVIADAAIAGAEPRRLWREARATAAQGAPGQYDYDLGGLFPLDRLRLALPQPNSLARVQVLARARASDRWRPVTEAIVYRLTRAGVEVTSPDIAIPVNAERYWRVQVDARSGGLGAGVPALTVGWIAQRIVFAARGEPPFRLAFGNRDAAGASYPIASLVPGYKPSDAIELPPARLASPDAGGVVPAPPVDRPDYRRWSLWGVLLLAVAVLAAMAYRLVRHVGGGASAGGTGRERDPPAS
jgi:hypothetical protein